jgi:hypothetical protein
MLHNFMICQSKIYVGQQIIMKKGADQSTPLTFTSNEPITTLEVKKVLSKFLS